MSSFDISEKLGIKTFAISEAIAKGWLERIYEHQWQKDNQKPWCAANMVIIASQQRVRGGPRLSNTKQPARF